MQDGNKISLEHKKHQLTQRAQQIFAESHGSEHKPLPFSVYSSLEDQHLSNVPIINPLLICVLGGMKQLGISSTEDNVSADKICGDGEFIFLSNTPNIDMRNISQNSGYCALLIEFQYDDFRQFYQHATNTVSYFKGSISDLLSNTLLQFVEWSEYAPSELWCYRRQEILQTLYHSGHQQVCAIAEPPSLTHKVERMVALNMQQNTDREPGSDITSEMVADNLTMSESTLRRKLAAENSHFQAIKDRVRLGFGLHLLQTTELPIGLIAEQTGYQSQSRFTDKFKSLFGLTPSELRKTRWPKHEIT